jgi:uncharacterized membrane protein YhhN
VIRLLFSVSILAGLAHLITIPWHPFPGVIVLKGLTVAPLALAAALRRRWWLATALALGSLGDVLLGLHGMFLAGLGAFLGGHLCYIRYFIVLPAAPGRVLAPVALVVAMLGYGVWLSPSLGSMAVPAWLYLIAITGMAVTVVRARLAAPWAALGAIFFLISDATLAANRFHGRFAAASWIIWGTYCVAQIGLAWGGVNNAVIQAPEGRATLQEK